VPYTDAFKAQVVKRMVGPDAVSVAALARQVGVSQPTLSQWLREAVDGLHEARVLGPVAWSFLIPRDAGSGPAAEKLCVGRPTG